MANRGFAKTGATVGELLDLWLDHMTQSRRPSTIAVNKAKIEHANRPAVAVSAGQAGCRRLTAARMRGR